MAKLTLTDLADLDNPTTATTNINTNSASTEAALENTLSRDGTSPNQMLSELDMNSFRIVNLSAPASLTEPLRLQDLEDLAGGTVNINSSASVSSYTYPTGTARTIASKLNEYISVKDFGATGNGSTDDTIALAAVKTYLDALVAATTKLPVLVFPSGIYKCSAFPNLAYNDFTISTFGDVRIRYTGTSHAVHFNGGVGIGNLKVGPLIIEALSTAADGLRITACHHSTFEQPKVRGCGSAAIRLCWCVCTRILNPIVSNNEVDGFYSTPAPPTGIYLDRTSGLNYTSYCYIENPVIEGVDIGCNAVYALGNTIIGGTLEGCTTHGLILDTTSLENKIVGVDFEANAGLDIYLDGKRNLISGCDSETFVTLFNTSTIPNQCNEICGKSYSAIVVNAGVTDCLLHNLSFDRFGVGAVISDLGTRTRIFNCFNFSTGVISGKMITESNFGYSAGVGSAVTQSTSKSTGVTLNRVCGKIIMNGAALNAGTEVAFTLTNSNIAATDVIVVNIKTGGTSAAYATSVTAVAAGSCEITLSNLSAGNLSEAVELNFVVIKGVSS